jgi:hypothetical protein
MKLSSLAVRNVVAGVAMAGAMAFLPWAVGANGDGCPVETTCTEGELQGYTISCNCQGDGYCWKATQSWILCSCHDFPVVSCDCNYGCS